MTVLLVWIHFPVLKPTLFLVTLSQEGCKEVILSFQIICYQWTLPSCTMFIDIISFSLTQLSLTFSLSWNICVFTIVYWKPVRRSSVKGPCWCSFWRTGNDGLVIIMLVCSNRRRINWESEKGGFRTMCFILAWKFSLGKDEMLSKLLSTLASYESCTKPWIS